jgi:hypothetical protein
MQARYARDAGAQALGRGGPARRQRPRQAEQGMQQSRGDRA